MKIAGKERCLRCLHELNEAGECEYCHYDQDEYEYSLSSLAPNSCLNNRYFLGKVLGEGGFGITYIAWDMILAIPVAVKEYFPEGLVRREGHTGIHVHEGDSGQIFQKGMDDFLREARTLSRFMKLHGIVSVRDYFQENGTAYIVMEHLEGSSIKEYIREHGAQSGRWVLGKMEPVISSLRAIHESGLIHRDISADNLLLTGEGDIYLIDFGAARNTDIQMRTTTVSIKRGFSPEEQYRERGEQGAWSDIYSLCATMYYMLTGVVPEESVTRLVRDSVRPLSEWDGLDLTPEQSAALDKGMAVLKEERLQKTDELYGKLYPGHRDETFIPVESPVPNRPPRRADSVSRTAIRRELGRMETERNVRKKWVIPVIIAAVILVSGAVWWVFFSEKSGPAAEQMPSPAAEQTSSQAAVSAPPRDTELPASEEPPHSTGLPASEEPPRFTERPVPAARLARVPDVKGILYKKAVKTLKKSKLKAKRVWKKSGEKRGIVVSQRTGAGEKVSEGKRITLYVSRGPEKKPQPTPRVTKKPVPTVKPKKKNDYVGSLDEYF